MVPSTLCSKTLILHTLQTFCEDLLGSGMCRSGRVVVTPQRLPALEHNHPSLLLCLFVLGGDEEALAEPSLQDLFQIGSAVLLYPSPDGFGCLPAEECREDVVFEAQGVVRQVVRVCQDDFLGQPGEVVELDAPLGGPNGDEEQFHAGILELGQDIAVQLPCKLLAEGSPHRPRKHQDTPLIFLPQLSQLDLSLGGRQPHLYAFQALELLVSSFRLVAITSESSIQPTSTTPA